MSTTLIIAALIILWANCVLQFVALLHLQSKVNNLKDDFLNYKLRKGNKKLTTEIEHLNKFKRIYTILESQLNSINLLKEAVYPNSSSDNNLSKPKEDDGCPIYPQTDEKDRGITIINS